MKVKRFLRMLRRGDAAACDRLRRQIAAEGLEHVATRLGVATEEVLRLAALPF